jgi:hypothetical protein
VLGFAAELIRTVESARSDLIELGVLTAKSTPELGRLNRSDIEQIVAGYCAMLVESLAERGRDTYHFYTDTVISGAIARGESVQAIMKSVTTFNILVISYLGQRVRAELYPEANAYLARWGAECCVDMLDMALRASNVAVPTLGSSHRA